MGLGAAIRLRHRRLLHCSCALRAPTAQTTGKRPSRTIGPPRLPALHHWTTTLLRGQRTRAQGMVRQTVSEHSYSRHDDLWDLIGDQLNRRDGQGPSHIAAHHQLPPHLGGSTSTRVSPSTRGTATAHEHDNGDAHASPYDWVNATTALARRRAAAATVDA
eukprot:4331422-Pyramimonas_sp.AAC.1